MVIINEVETFCPSSRADWRNWLQKNHSSKQSVWLVYYKSKSGMRTLTWSDAVEEALCFGWIDSVRKTLDDERFVQLFSRRKPKGTWSKVNKEKIKQLIENGSMTPAGIDVIEAAKQNGSWTIIDDVEALIIPEDLEKEFKVNPGSKELFLSLSRSEKKIFLQQLVLAKKPETRQKRITEIVKQVYQRGTV